MEEIHVHKLNEVVMQVRSTSGTVRSDLKDAFSFYVPNFRHMPRYKMGIWDGKISLYNGKTQTMYVGLLSNLLSFADSRNISVLFDDESFEPPTTPDLEGFLSMFKPKYELRDYQRQILDYVSKMNRAIFLSATGSGKSLSVYSLVRYLNKKTLIIVPSIHLVGQLYNDFVDYASTGDHFSVDDSVQQIHGGKSRDISKQIVISTWQSIYQEPEEWFSEFDVVIADECHEDKSNCIRKLLEKCTRASFRYGFTGTLDGTHANEMVLTGLFGQVCRVSTTNQLIDKGVLAKLQIKQTVLVHPAERRKGVARSLYSEEVEYLVGCPKRNQFIANLTLKCPGNTLVLFQRVETHGKLLVDELERINAEKSLGKKIFFVHGKVPKEERIAIVNRAETEDDVIIVASLGTFSRGINIKNIEFLIFAFGLKAKITTLQGIGRGLRIGKSDKVTVFDVCDDLTWKSWENYSLRHAKERLKIYQQERFDYQIRKVDLS